jgi:hypothetical protein
MMMMMMMMMMIEWQGMCVVVLARFLSMQCTA